MNAVVATLERPTAVVDAAKPLRHALGAYPTGVTIVTARAPDGRAVGLTV
ncbi:MAG TPA: flavin reductase, partial [Burkholderiaceae bacterium]|nr:flavin reductase [Burkholderiaceae bacterium]